MDNVEWVMDDGWEAWNDSDPLVPMPVAILESDDDNDGLTFLQESVFWTDPDQDGWSNYTEYEEGTDPLNPDTDFDGLLDRNDPHPLIPDGSYVGQCDNWVRSAYPNLAAPIIHPPSSFLSGTDLAGFPRPLAVSCCFLLDCGYGILIYFAPIRPWWAG